MRLDQFSIQKYRSIIKAEKLRLGDLTVLVGPNNEGKSNILQALVTGMQELSGERPGIRPSPSAMRRHGRRASGYDWERDFPQSLQEDQPSGRTTMKFDFSLTEDEVEEFHEAVGSRLNGILPIQLTFGTGRPTFTVRKQRHAQVLSARREEIAQFVARRVLVQYIPAVRTAGVAADNVRSMVIRELAAAERNPEYQRAVEKLRELQQPILDRLSEAISSKMQELLPDVASVDLSLDERPGVAFREVRIVVDDGIPTELELKGDGVQSLAALSVIQHYSTSTARAKEFILAVEEPEAHLHPKAIHGLRSALLDTSTRQQVVLTTHSPLFVNRLEVDANVIVERTQARAASSVQELRDVLGVRTSDNLQHAEVILVVEGSEDEVALRALLAHQSPLLQTALAEGTLTFYPLLGGGNLTYVLSMLRDSLAAVHAFLDDDAAGRRASAIAEDEGLLVERDRHFAVLPGSTETEFEDLIDPALYGPAMQERFGISIEHPWINAMGRGKWSARMRFPVQASGKTWDPKRLPQYKSTVAEAVAAKPSAALKPGAKSLVRQLVAELEHKVSARQQ